MSTSPGSYSLASLTLSVSETGLILYAVDNGYFDNIELKDVGEVESRLMSFMYHNHKDYMDDLAKTGDINEEILASFKSAIEKFMETI